MPECDTFRKINHGLKDEKKGEHFENFSVTKMSSYHRFEDVLPLNYLTSSQNNSI